MSIKENEINESYHITNQDDFNKMMLGNNTLEKKEEEEEEEEEEDEVNHETKLIIGALEDIMSELKGVKPEDIEEVVKTILTDDDKSEIINLYYGLFHDLPNNNSIKIYVLHLLNTLYIPIVRNTTEFNELYKKQIEKNNEYEGDDDDGNYSDESDIKIVEIVDDLSKSII